MKPMLAEYTQPGPSFFIPVMVDNDNNIIGDFAKDAIDANIDDEDVYSEEEKAAAYFAMEAEKQLMRDENNFPYK